MNLFQHHPSTIKYSNNTEYRACIRRIFDFTKDAKSYYADLTENDFDNNLDEESKDEMEFDTVNMQHGLDFILNNTVKDNDSYWEDVYLLAAATMFSTDITIGQAVLCSYDYFAIYYTCLWHFFIDKSVPVPEYQQLRAMFRK